MPLTIAYVGLAYWTREAISPSLQMGRMGGTIAAVNSRYRTAHHNLAQHGEAILFAGGVAREAERIRGIFGELMTTWQRLLRLSTQSSIGHSLIQLQGGGLVDFQNVVLHLPFLLPNHPLRPAPGATTDAVMEANAAMLGQMSIERNLLMQFMHRLEEMIQLPRQILSSSGSMSRVVTLLAALDPGNYSTDLESDDGSGSTISFSNVDVITPTGTKLVSGLSLDVSAGGEDNLLVVGESGVGKTSIFRALAGLWPVDGGISRPGRTSIMFLPSEPYIARGCALGELICYPHRTASLPSEHVLAEVLAKVGLNAEPLLRREKEARRREESVDWADVLSQEQKTRLCVARVFFQKPFFAVLDDCLSTLDKRSEREIYQTASQLGITLITVALPGHAVHQFHSRVLSVAGGGIWSLAPVDAELKAELLRTQSLAIAAHDAKAEAERKAADSLQASIDDRTKAYVATAHAETNTPTHSNLTRLGTILRILVPRLTLADKGIRLIIAQFAMLLVSVTLGTGFMSSIFSEFQGLAMRGNVTGYIRLTVLRTVLQVVMTGMGIALQNINT